MSDQKPGTDKKNLWIVDQYAVPSTISGFTRQYEHAMLLEQLGWDVEIIASPFNHKSHQLERPVSPTKIQLKRNESGIDFVWVYTTPYTGNGLKRYLNMASFVLTSLLPKRGVPKPDAVLGSSPHLLTPFAAWIMARRYRVPFVMEVRDLWPESLIQLGLSNPMIIKPLEILESFLYKRADSIVTLTEGQAVDLCGRIDDPQKVTVMPNAVLKPVRISKEDRLSVRSQMGWGEDEIIAIYGGAHGDANDLGQIVEAARSTPSNSRIRYVLVGDGPTKPALIAQADGLDNVDFVDSVPKSAIAELLQSADIGLLTLKQIPLFEGARPNKLFDYMGAALPIVSTVRGETESVLDEAESGIAVPTNDLSNAVQELASDHERRQKMAEAGFEYSSNVRTREDVAGDLAELLNGLVQK